MQTEFDLVIYGATGFTGRLAAQYIMRPGIGDRLCVAIAGRNPQKLEEVQASCQIKPAILIADSTQPTTIETMVKKSKVILSMAGPYALYGESVIAACSKFGIDYLDITGETPFIHSMIEKYQQQALVTGARLIPFSGFDSVPADLTVYQAQMAAQNKGVPLDEMCFYYQIKGGFNGGTLATALNMAENLTGTTHMDANSLIPNSAGPKKPRTKMSPRFEPTLRRWTAPFFMSPINKAVVRRSAWLRSEDKDDASLQYDERLVMGKHLGYLQASLASMMLVGFGLLSANAVGRKILRRMGPKPGEGPSEEVRRQGFFRGQLVCRSQGECKLIVRMERRGDPGNDITVALAGESARLAAENAFLPNRRGFLTPTFAFGNQLTERLAQAGFRFKTEFF